MKERIVYIPNPDIVKICYPNTTAFYINTMNKKGYRLISVVDFLGKNRERLKKVKMRLG